MAFCTNCGKKLNPGARFCTFCGTQVRSVEPVNAPAFTPDFSGNANQGVEEAPKQKHLQLRKHLHQKKLQ